MLSVLGGEPAPGLLSSTWHPMGTHSLLCGGGHDVLGTRILQSADCHTDMPSARPKKALR